MPHGTGKIKYTFNECLKYDTDKLMDKFDHYENKHSDQPSKFVEPRKAARLDEKGNVSSAYRKPAFQPSAFRQLFIGFQPSAENQPISMEKSGSFKRSKSRLETRQ